METSTRRRRLDGVEADQRSGWVPRRPLRAHAVGRARVQRQQQLGQLLDDAAAAGAVLGLGGHVVRAAAALRDDGVEGLCR